MLFAPGLSQPNQRRPLGGDIAFGRLRDDMVQHPASTLPAFPVKFPATVARCPPVRVGTHGRFGNPLTDEPPSGTIGPPSAHVSISALGRSGLIPSIMDLQSQEAVDDEIMGCRFSAHGFQATQLSLAAPVFSSRQASMLRPEAIVIATEAPP